MQPHAGIIDVEQRSCVIVYGLHIEGEFVCTLYICTYMGRYSNMYVLKCLANVCEDHHPLVPSQEQ